jgi:hypothetical protein
MLSLICVLWQCAPFRSTVSSVYLLYVVAKRLLFLKLNVALYWKSTT